MDKSSEQSPKPNIIRYNNQPCKKQTKSVQIQPGTKDNSNGKTKKEYKMKSPHHNVAYVPDTNLTLACMVCLCFNLPLGAVAMYLSLSAARAYRDGDPKSGDIRAKSSVFISLLSIVTTVLIVMSIVLWVVVQNQAKDDLRRAPT